MSTVAVTLTQTKFKASARWAVTTLASAASPTRLGYPFVLQSTPGGTDPETFLRVATNAEVQTGGLPTNALDLFHETTDLLLNAYAWVAGDVLRISTLVPEWDITGPDYDFVILGRVASTLPGVPWRLQVETPFPFCKIGTAPLPLVWSIMRGGALHMVGNALGATRRTDETVTTFITDRYVGVFDQAADALDHTLSVQAMVKALRDDQVFATTDYTNYPPGNPITNTYDS